MVESQDSIYNLDHEDFNLTNFNSDEFQLDMVESDINLNFSPSLFTDKIGSEEVQSIAISYNNNFNTEVINYQDVNRYQPILVETSHLDNLPVLDPLETDWCFNIELNSESASKSSWMFSSKLNKVFVKINTFLNVHATYKVIDPNQLLYVRAMIVYTSPNEIADPVKKCPNHRQPNQPNQDYPEHILRCEVKDTEYVGVEQGKLFKDKLAILIPMKDVAANEPLKLIFTCQNSCSSGMNRKMTSIVFTLENEQRVIHGRKVMHFKVCSCPKRDKDKDEESIMKTLPKKRKSEALPSTSKKVAVQVPIVKQENDTTMMTLSDPMLTQLPSDLQSLNFKKEAQSCAVNVTMPSPDMKQQLLRYAFDLIAGEMLRSGDDTTYQSYLSDIQKQIDENL